MSASLISPLRTAGFAALLCSMPAQGATVSQESLKAQLDALRRQVAEQSRLIEKLSQAVAAQDAVQAAEVLQAAELLKAAEVLESPEASHASEASQVAESASGVRANMGAIRQTAAERSHTALTSSPNGMAGPESALKELNIAADPLVPLPASTLTTLSGTGAAVLPGARDSSAAPAASPHSPQAEQGSQTARRLARPPASSATARASPPARPPAVAPLFQQPGVLTPKGKLIFEPALQFGYSSSNRVALVGYTIIPALLIGLVDVREIKRSTTTVILGGRYGVSNRLEIEARLPYVYRSDATVSREIFTGTAVENVFSTSGKDIGDAEVGLRYQLNAGGVDRAFYVGSLRLKSRTGRDPFSVVTDCARRCIGPNASGTGLPLELPTGSGFYSIQPGLTWLYPSDPAVFFGSVSYLHNLRRENVSRTVLGGEQEFLGDVEPGGVVGFNFGMGIALNDQTSLSLGYDHSSIGRTKQAGIAVPGSVRTQLGTLLVGFSYRINARRTVSVSVGAGLTRDTPDVSLTLRLPTTF